METLLLLVAAIVLYFLSDRVLRQIETHLGKRLEHRSLIFFAILLSSALASFWLIRLVTAP
jgi:hypothetical protein